MLDALGRLAVGRYGRIRGYRFSIFLGERSLHRHHARTWLAATLPYFIPTPLPYSSCFGAETQGFLLAAVNPASSSHWRGLLICAFAPCQGNRI